ncbi:hypothetical protein H1Q58_12040 [Planococcus maritimus]|uniref:Uncharacterized protein n=1 Tax=Planococcus maritimus TaxID=192421 RepID=A0A7D7MAA4_PLAMR|nr:hypothetical protein [Planococcus maritimus]QMT16695.1 hypothetical protein H1Q58_12040 [Planococcus maritimus]
MSKLIQLQKYILANDFQFSRLGLSTNQDDRKHAFLTLAGYCAAVVMVIGYIVYIAFDLYSNEESTLFFPILSSILFWTLGFWTILSGIKKMIVSSDTEFIFSLPIPLWQAKLFNVIKLLILYLLIAATAIFVGILLHMFIIPDFWFVLLSSLLLVVILPLLVITTTFIISLTVKILLNFLTIHSNVIEALLTIFLFLSPLLYITYSTSSLEYKDIFSISSPLYLFGIISNSTPEFGFFNSVSLLIITLVLVFITGYLFTKRHAFLAASYSTSSKRKARDSSTFSSNSLFKNLFSKELKLYLSSITYVSNTVLTPALLLMGSLAYLFNISSLLYDYTLELSFITMSSKYIFILFTTVCILLTTTTSSSLSFEGQSIWILLTSPLSLMELAKAKMALNVLLFVPGLACAILVYTQNFSSSLLDSLLFISFTLTSLLLISMLGFFVNLKFPNYNWSSEMEVIKQGKSTIITAIISSFLISITAILILLDFNFTFQLLLLVNVCIIIVLIYKLRESSLLME